MAIGGRIKRVREGLSMSQVELAEACGISKQTLYKYENNIVTNIPSDKIELIAKKLNVTPAYLMGWDDCPFLKTVYDRIEFLCKDKGISVSQMCKDLKINLNVLSEFKKNELEAKIEPISEEACKTTERISKYFKVSIGYLYGDYNDLNLARKLAGGDICGKAELVDYTPEDKRVMDFASKLDQIPYEDRNNVLDVLEHVVKMYYQTLLSEKKRTMPQTDE